MPHPLVDSGSVNPVLLQGMMIVLLFIWYVGVQVGSSVGTVVQPLWLQPGGKSPGGGKTEPLGAGLQVEGPGVQGGGGGAAAAISAVVEAGVLCAANSRKARGTVTAG